MHSSLARAAIVLGAAAFMLSAGISSAAPKVEPLTVRSGTLRGTVTDSTGKALPDVPLWLMTEGKIVKETKSDKTGKYALQDLTAGKFDLYVSNRHPMKVLVSQDAETKTLNIVLPVRAGQAALENTQWVWIGAGGVAAVAVATPIVANNVGGGGGGGSHVSP